MYEVYKKRDPYILKNNHEKNEKIESKVLALAYKI